MVSFVGSLTIAVVATCLVCAASAMNTEMPSSKDDTAKSDATPVKRSPMQGSNYYGQYQGQYRPNQGSYIGAGAQPIYPSMHPMQGNGRSPIYTKPDSGWNRHLPQLPMIPILGGK